MTGSTPVMAWASQVRVQMVISGLHDLETVGLGTAADN